MKYAGTIKKELAAKREVEMKEANKKMDSFMEGSRYNVLSDYCKFLENEVRIIKKQINR
jgi:hypothetical protein